MYMPEYMHELTQTSVIKGENKILSNLVHCIGQINFVKYKIFTVPISLQIQHYIWMFLILCERELYYAYAFIISLTKMLSTDTIHKFSLIVCPITILTALELVTYTL